MASQQTDTTSPDTGFSIHSPGGGDMKATDHVVDKIVDGINALAHQFFEWSGSHPLLFVILLLFLLGIFALYRFTKRDRDVHRAEYENVRLERLRIERPQPKPTLLAETDLGKLPAPDKNKTASNSRSGD